MVQNIFPLKSPWFKLDKNGAVVDNFGAFLAHFGYVVDNVGNVLDTLGNTETQKNCIFTPKTQIEANFRTSNLKPQVSSLSPAN